MTDTTRRERLRADTEREIRHQARQLLVGKGPAAVTLRAIARELGITAPALYRYYDSREDLIRRVCDDICSDLATDLNAELSTVPEDDTPGQLFAVCRGFRRWALAHPEEFTLVFASRENGAPGCVDGAVKPAHDQFGRIFLHVAGRVLATNRVPTPETDVPAGVDDDLGAFRTTLLETLDEGGIVVPPEVLNPGTVYFMLQFWTRLYGHVALEVFGRFPFALTNPEPLFETMLADLARQAGLAGHADSVARPA